MTEYCECCGKAKSVRWYLLDNNVEVTLCSSCAKDLKIHADIKRIN